MSPEVHGQPIHVTFVPELKAHRGKLLTGREARGREVHAASFLRERRIVLDAALKKKPRELERILTHELFHFAWLRLGNPKRWSYEELLEAEIRGRIPGELGWSAERTKGTLDRADRVQRSRRWREYVCESFCDSGAWLLSAHRHAEFTLPAPARRARREWFEHQMPAYHAYPSSGDTEPKPLPNCFRLSVTVRRVMYLTLL